MKTIEICAGGGGQALGLHHAGAEHLALVEIDEHACKTLSHNNKKLSLGWGEIHCKDLKRFVEENADEFRGSVDLVAGGVPCPPFSKAGKKLGRDDERDLFPTAIKLVKKTEPAAVLLENVPGLMEKAFSDYRAQIKKELFEIGYTAEWYDVQANKFGVPQLRPRAILVAFRTDIAQLFTWRPKETKHTTTVGEALYEEMASNGWHGAKEWAEKANKIAPTIVGGSKKHGGPDLGPTRAKKQWQALGVNGHRIGNAEEIPGPQFKGAIGRTGEIRPGFEGMPLLTVDMVATLQGFPKEWEFVGSKTHAYRQVGNAFPPPVAEAIGVNIKAALLQSKQHRVSTEAAE